MPEPAAKPLYELLNRIRQPVALREIIALCLRHVYMGDPFVGDSAVALRPPPKYMSGVEVAEIQVAGTRCMLYKPKQRSTNKLPSMIYMHGGGFVTGCSEDTDYTTRRLCLDNGLGVLSVNYPLAPEAAFPVALNSCIDIADWLSTEGVANELDPDRVFLCGDSAGGNLACATAVQLKQQGQLVCGLILLAPLLDMNVESYESYNRLAPQGIVFDAAFIGYARAAYVQYADWSNQLASPFHCDPAHLPPTLLIVGTADPLADQAIAMYTKAMSKSCNHVRLVKYEGMPHCFYSFPGLFEQENDCYLQMSNFIDSIRA